MFLPQLFHTLKIHSHMYSPDFYLNGLANSLSSLVVQHTCSRPTLSTYPLEVCLALCLVIGLETTIGEPWGHQYYLAWRFLQRVTAGLAQDEGLVSSVGEKAVFHGEYVCWRCGVYFLSRDKPLKIWAFKVLTPAVSSHTSPSQGSHSLPISALALTADIL